MMNIVETTPRNSGASVVCQCACGNFWRGKLSVAKRIKSCTCAVKIHDMLGRGELNYNIQEIRTGNNRPMNVDIALPFEKIAVEYSEWYWHREKIDKDAVKVQRLLNYGWRVLTILARQNLPNQEQLFYGLLQLQHLSQYTITLDGWGED